MQLAFTASGHYMEPDASTRRNKRRDGHAAVSAGVVPAPAVTSLLKPRAAEAPGPLCKEVQPGHGCGDGGNRAAVFADLMGDLPAVHDRRADTEQRPDQQLDPARTPPPCPNTSETSTTTQTTGCSQG